MRKEGIEGGKERGREGGGRLPADNEIKPIREKENNTGKEVTAGLLHTQLYCL